MRSTLLLTMLALAIVATPGATFASGKAFGKEPRKVEVVNEVEVFVVNPAAPPAVQDVFVTNPSGGGCSSPPRFQLVGFTSVQRSCADIGIRTFQETCQAEYPGSRMCTSAEILETTAIPTGLSGEAFVRPILGAQLQTTSVVDAPTAVGGKVSNFTCGGWSGYNIGFLVTDQFRFKFAGSTSSSSGFPAVASVSCCAPVP